MSRISERLNEEEIKLAFVFLLTMPGVPFIYYGDEIGMRHLAGTPSVEGGFERTASRSPMQWDRTVNAGFSSADPELLYIPIDPDLNRPTAEKALQDSNSIYHEIQQLIVLRRAVPALCSSGAITSCMQKKTSIRWFTVERMERKRLSLHSTRLETPFPVKLIPLIRWKRYISVAVL